MANFGIRASRSLPQRGPAPGVKFFIYAVLAVVLMYLDRTSGWLERVRYGLAAAAYPLQLAANSPSAAWRWTRETFETRDALQAENSALRRQLRELELRSARHAALERENAQLRGLRAALPPVAEKWLVGEVIGSEAGSLRQRLVVNRGAEQGVFKGQTVIAEGGVLGQTLRVGPWSAEIMLLTDPEHAVPVQVLRSGLRTIAVGSGEADTLQLPYLPIQSDIRVGDQLVTSGLGGVFPAGHPVATITAVERGGGSPLAQVRAKPLAALDRDREVLFVWFRAAHPAAPADETPAPAAAAALALQPVVVTPMATTTPTAAAPSAATPTAAPPAVAPAPTTTPTPSTAPAPTTVPVPAAPPPAGATQPMGAAR